MTYDGLEACFNNNQSLQEESGRSRGNECLTDSLDDDAFSSCSSSKDTSESFSSKWLPKKNGKHISNEWDYERSPKHFYSKEERPGYTLCSSDVEAMKEKFSKLLLGGDLTGGRKGVQTALALSNAISHLANSVFGELWKLEPLSEDNKQRWRREMDWLLSPCSHMIELVPSKLDDKNGRSLESGKTSLGDELFRMLASESASVDEIFVSLRLRTEHSALETVNRLEAAIYAWKEKFTEQRSSGKWSLVRDSLSEITRIEPLINKAERLNGQIKSKYSNLPHSFLDATKIQYGKDIGHAILEAYSRILASLAFRILSRIREILQEDALSNPSSPATPSCFSGSNDLFRTPERLLVSSRLRHSLIHDINKADDGTRNSSDFLNTDPRGSSFSLI
uniref:PRONE domain-containing protein n=1 Tax=Brassica campestris TaxID=3711 RepID=M4CM84_BRACM